MVVQHCHGAAMRGKTLLRGPPNFAATTLSQALQKGSKTVAVGIKSTREDRRAVEGVSLADLGESVRAACIVDVLKASRFSLSCRNSRNTAPQAFQSHIWHANPSNQASSIFPVHCPCDWLLCVIIPLRRCSTRWI